MKPITENQIELCAIENGSNLEDGMTRFIREVSLLSQAFALTIAPAEKIFAFCPMLRSQVRLSLLLFDNAVSRLRSASKTYKQHTGSDQPG